MRRTLFLLLTLVPLAAGGALAVKSKRARVAAAPAPTLRPTPVRVARAAIGTLEDRRAFLGRVLPWQAAELSAQIGARVLEVKVREGDRVRKGQVLVVLDDDELRNAVAEVEAQIRQAEAQAEAQAATAASLERTAAYWQREVERDTALAREGAIAQAAADATADRLNEALGRLEAARKALAAAQGQVEALRRRLGEVSARLAYTRIRSPFPGVVARRLCDPGDLGVPGRPLVRVEDTSRWRVAFDVPQGDLGRVGRGSTVRIGDLDLTLRVDRVYPSLNPDRTCTMEAYAPGEAPLASGTFHPLEVVLQRFENAVLVPEASLVRTPDGKTAVFTVAGGRTRPVPVTPRIVREGLAAVEGVEPGTEVVVSTYLGWNRLAAGELVEAVR